MSSQSLNATFIYIYIYTYVSYNGQYYTETVNCHLIGIRYKMSMYIKYNFA